MVMKKMDCKNAGKAWEPRMRVAESSTNLSHVLVLGNAPVAFPFPGKESCVDV